MKRLALLVALAALAVFAAVGAQAGANVTVGHSGWEWGNPQPQGNTLRAVEFKGSLGIAAGEFGTLLRTSDGGASWAGIASGTTASLEHIAFADASTVVVAGGCYLSRSTDGGQTFQTLTPVCSSRIVSLGFPSAPTGYLLRADGSVSKTTDGGASFTAGGPIPGTAATSPTGPADTATGIFFSDTSTGFAVTRGSSGGAVYRTTDGGQTWFKRTTSTHGLTDVSFPDAAVGYAVGSANTVLKTTDGGETWNPKPLPDAIPTSELMSVRCVTTSTCLIATESGERVVRTTNGGGAYTSFSPAAQKIFAVAYSGPSSAVAAGDHGTMVISTNVNSSSPSFVPVADQPLSGTFSRLRAGSAALVVAPGQNGKLARSTDGGRHWTTNQLPTSEDLRDAWFVDGNVGFAIDAGGGVLRTIDGGDGWSFIDGPTGLRPSAVYATSDMLLLFGPSGVTRAAITDTLNNFDTIESKAVAKAGALLDYDRTTGAALFAYSRRALIVSRDQGLTWKAVRAPVKGPRYRRVDFSTAQLGFALLENGRLFRTSNGGKAWREVLSTGTARAYDMSFVDGRGGFLSIDRFGRSGRSGWVLRTSDGGTTWRPQLIAPDPLGARGLVAPGGGSGFGLALGTEFFFTSTRGDQAATASKLKLTPARTLIVHSRRVKIAGKLTPALEGARVTVLARNNVSHAWSVAGQRTVSAAGTFSISPQVRRTTQFVAQWPGNSSVNGAGSRVVTIKKR